MRLPVFLVRSAPERLRPNGLLLRGWAVPGAGVRPVCAAPQGLRGAFLEPVLAPDTLVNGPRGKVTILEPFASSRSPGTRLCPPLIPKPRSQQSPLLIPQFWEGHEAPRRSIQ